MNKYSDSIKSVLLPGFLHSYSMVFFAKDVWFGLLLLLVSFVNPIAGFVGMLSVLITLCFALIMGFSKEYTGNGLYGFNSMMVGLGLGTFFQITPMFLIVVVFASLLTFGLTIVLSGWLSKYGLPFLSLPFVLGFWLMLLATREFSVLEHSQRSIYWMNELIAVGGDRLFNFYTMMDGLPLPVWLKGYLVSLSAIFFQENIITGALISIGILYYSRIAFSITLISYLSACAFGYFSGISAEGLNYYNLGANFILTAIAIGGFFLIPAASSYLSVILLTPVITFLLVGVSVLMKQFQLPVYSLPFSLTVIFYLYFLANRVKSKFIVLTPLQYFSPEQNLYRFKNNSERIRDGKFVNLSVPFYGEWMVTQGYEGSVTHKGEWSKALDFMLLDEEMRTYSDYGINLENYYCYNKPVLAPGDGIVEELVDWVPDNPVGKMNIDRNWGNALVIRHATGLYTKVTHLKLGSFKVKVGDYITKGQWIANVGNSGRSPEPHLHFQIQETPYIGSKTKEYPFGYYIVRKNSSFVLKNYEIPEEGELISNVFISPMMSQAFKFQPGQVTRYRYVNAEGKEVDETWEAAVDNWNSQYLRCKETGSVAYFVNNGTLFYFVSYIGKGKDLLFYFYKSAYKVLLSYYQDLVIEDNYPLHLNNSGLNVLLQDFVAPFKLYLKSKYVNRCHFIDDIYAPSIIQISGFASQKNLNKPEHNESFELTIKSNRVDEFVFKSELFEIKAICID